MKISINDIHLKYIVVTDFLNLGLLMTTKVNVFPAIPKINRKGEK